MVQAREALRKNDRAALSAAAQQLSAAQHPLTQWAEYWDLSSRLDRAQQPELTAFFQRWPDTYVEDRLRNDWLLELGKRRDWANFRIEQPRFRMDDDRQVTCYTLLMQHQDGKNVREQALAAWHAQRDLDDACMLLARTLAEARVISAQDIWQDVRLATEANRQSAARAAAALISPAAERAVDALWDQPARHLTQRQHLDSAYLHELDLLALMRTAASDPAVAADQLLSRWQARLPAPIAATAWAHVARQAALKRQPEAADYARNAWALWDSMRSGSAGRLAPPWSEDVLAWHVRAALLEGGDRPARWQLVLRATDAMDEAARRDGRENTWLYWQARAQLALARPGAAGDAARAAAQQSLRDLASPLGFYGQLAASDLGLSLSLPPAPPALSAEDLAAPRQHPGKTRALRSLALGLRSEGVREWNYSLRGLNDRQLRAASHLACQREVWDRCINTSERAREEIDIQQRFPTPFRAAIESRARAEGLDPALVIGLIRQESRFMSEIRSHVGASGLMQLMPATARWTAKRAGVDYTNSMIADPEINLQLGAVYLKHVLDEFQGSMAMATAAYNAGPNRPRRWREGTPIEAAAWAETIPFNETRDYVKKVLSNAVVYSALLKQRLPPDLKGKLGGPIGPREANAPASNREIP